MNRSVAKLRTGRTLTIAVAAVALLAACGSSAKSIATTASPATGSIGVSAIWARTSPTVAGAGALYFTINNTGGVDDALIGARVDPSIAATAGLHETVAVAASGSTAAGGMNTTAGGGAMMQMRPVDRIVVPAHGSVALAPGGYHIMMEGLVKPLTAGGKVNVTLTFETSGDKIVTADVRDTAP